jgi:hypothetical protein
VDRIPEWLWRHQVKFFFGMVLLLVLLTFWGL